MVELLTLLWLFNASAANAEHADRAGASGRIRCAGEYNQRIHCQVHGGLEEVRRREKHSRNPGVLNVRLRQHDPPDRNRQNYPAFKMPDGSVPVLEATIVIHSPEHPDWKNMTVGIPLAMLKNPEGEHDVVLNFSGVRWTMYVDGELLDNDFPFGYPRWAEKNTWKLDAEYVKKAAIYLPAITARKENGEKARHLSGIQYWTPAGHNNWVGDVVTFYHQGRYHVSICMTAAITRANLGRVRTTSNTFQQRISRHGPNTRRRRLSTNNGSASARVRRSSSMANSVSATACTLRASIPRGKRRFRRNMNT